MLWLITTTFYTILSNKAIKPKINHFKFRLYSIIVYNMKDGY